jgi:hypothetical protein
MSNVNVQRTALLLGTSLLLSACGVTHAPPTAAPRAAVQSAHSMTAKRLATLDGPLTANRVLTYAHAVAHQLDAKACFTGLVGTHIAMDGQPTGEGTWTVQYVGSEVDEARKGKNNPYNNKFTRRIAVVVNAEGQPTVTETTEQGMPLGVAYLDSPLPEVDSCDVLKILRKERPATTHAPVERMSLMGHPRDFSVLLWKINPATTQSGERPMTINAHSGDIVSSY